MGLKSWYSNVPIPATACATSLPALASRGCWQAQGPRETDDDQPWHDPAGPVLRIMRDGDIPAGSW